MVVFQVNVEINNKNQSHTAYFLPELDPMIYIIGLSGFEE